MRGENTETRIEELDNRSTISKFRSAMTASKRICLVPNLSGTGGMVSFRDKLAEGLARRGLQTCANLDDRPYDAVLVIGGTRNIGKLWLARRRGIPIVQRLDGMNWIHRVKSTGLRHFFRAEYGNTLLSYIRSSLATRVVYQSEFSRKWWERERGPTKVPNQVIHNGVDLGWFSPQGPGSPPSSHLRILLVEGSLGGGYEGGLRNAVGLVRYLGERMRVAHSQSAGISQRMATEQEVKLAGSLDTNHEIELVVVGRVSHEIQDYWESYIRKASRGNPIIITWTGIVHQERIPEIDRSAHLLFSADLNAACPNSVIEAMACGTPVIAFATGALPELVQGYSGRVVPYGADPWKLEEPDLNALSAEALEILQNQERFRAGARQRAVEAFGLDEMVARYLAVLLD